MLHTLLSHQVFPSVVTTRQLALDPISVPMVVPTNVPHLVTTRHLVLDPGCVPNAAVPTSVTIRQLNFDVRSRCSNCRTNVCPLHLVRFAVSRHKLTPSHIDSPPNVEMLPPGVGLDCS